MQEAQTMMPLPEVRWPTNSGCSVRRWCSCVDVLVIAYRQDRRPSFTHPMAQASAAVMSKQQEIMQELELRRRMKTVVVPTNDGEVRRLLRELGEPITLFGEREVGGQGEHASCQCFGFA